VAHPGLVPIAKQEFDAAMPEANQIGRRRDDVAVGAADLLEIPEGAITEAGVRLNVSVGIRYIESWLRGNGCVPLFNLIEDAATAEISRAQLWQWLRHGATLDDGRTVDAALLKTVIAEEVAAMRAELGSDAENRLDEAVALFETVATAPDFAEFLTLPAYAKITTVAPA
jgi:malate synthase